MTTTAAPYNPFAANTISVFGWVAIDNIGALEARVRALLFDEEGKPRPYTKVCAYEYAGFRPEVFTSQRAEKITVCVEDATEEVDGRAAITIVDSYGVWSIDSRLRDQADTRNYDEALRRGMYVSLDSNSIEIQLRTPEGRRAWWVVKLEEGASS